MATDEAGNLYGTTVYGGHGCEPSGCGTVFKLAPSGRYKVLHFFKGAGQDGQSPETGLIRDKEGNLYGSARDGNGGCGSVFKITSKRTYSLLHVFGADPDGCGPASTLTMDAQGNLYGTTSGGGVGYGTVFKLAPDGTETILYSFQGGNDGSAPWAGVIFDKAGNLYGATVMGTGNGCLGNTGCGVVFKLTPDRIETVLHAFRGTDGEWPYGTLIADKNGNLYGTTAYGGATTNCQIGCGTVFALTEQ
jgi:uncharacterized repeat protein (TIGR03803 family)